MNWIRATMMVFRWCVALAVSMGIGASTWSDETTREISFNRDVRPILSDNCFACHGPDANARQAELRLDLIDRAIESGVIVPGEPDESEVLRRIVSEDSEEKMPPADSHKELEPAEMIMIRDWIAGGADFERHWSYRPVVRPEVPQSDHPRVKNDVDAFVIDQLTRRSLDLSPQADRVTLVRRLYFDLTGLPPTFEQVQQFLSDSSDRAVENLVDQLMLNERFGERMAVYWLDLVRYADTIGYHNDTVMEVSAYRDYVIDAFNSNKPFDEFTMEQLAGDLLPDATQQQRIASGYNRLLQTTEEGGAQAKEYIAIYAADRVRNVSTVWMGQTVGCAQCHDHKYDPITTKDFYSLAAFFADIKEKGVGRRKPNLLIANPEQQAKIDRLTDQVELQQIENVLEADAGLRERLSEAQPEWETDSLVAFYPNAADRTPEQTRKLNEYFVKVTPLLSDARDRLRKSKKELEEFTKSLRTMLVSEALDEPRMTRILARGNWLDDSGEIVQPAVPEFLATSSIEGRRATRVDLAEWLFDDANPLTARTYVNRLWKLFFGRGLSPKLDDLGGQGEPPSHPELLDWLAVEFRESGWDVKHMVRLLVTSAAYAQDSSPDAATLDADPNNRWFSRQARWRLEAEFVRDAALSVSGLLVEGPVGGVSVKPYQPGGYWRHLNFPQREWKADSGDDLYRRSLYTFWCRTFPHPSMLAFDAPSREECTAERARSNVPQQALVLLNDPIFVESARAFGQRIAEQHETDLEPPIRWAIKTAFSRLPTAEEVQVLGGLYQSQLDRFRTQPEDARLLIDVGEAPIDASLDPAELAAWTQVARAIINAYEATSRS